MMYKDTTKQASNFDRYISPEKFNQLFSALYTENFKSNLYRAVINSTVYFEISHLMR